MLHSSLVSEAFIFVFECVHRCLTSTAICSHIRQPHTARLHNTELKTHTLLPSQPQQLHFTSWQLLVFCKWVASDACLVASTCSNHNVLFLALSSAAERIRTFFNAKKETYLPTELERSLSPETAFDWLVTFSQCNIDDLAEVCLEYIKDNPGTALPAGFSSSRLQPKHLEQLCRGLQAKNALLQTTVYSLRGQLAAATYRSDAPEEYHGYFCLNCRTQWYTQPNGTTPAPHCIKCGIPKQRGL
jgi:hypothetical protein